MNRPTVRTKDATQAANAAAKAAQRLRQYAHVGPARNSQGTDFCWSMGDPIGELVVALSLALQIEIAFSDGAPDPTTFEHAGHNKRLHLDLIKYLIETNRHEPGHTASLKERSA